MRLTDEESGTEDEYELQKFEGIDKPFWVRVGDSEESDSDD